MSRKRPRSESDSDIYRSESIHDRASTFVAAYSPAAPAEDLQALPEFKTATHRVAAWRTPSKQKTLSQKPIYTSGHDDDGEQYAGKKLERVLSDLDAQGAVVVARWYGGVLLGPVRFTHIEKCAREAIASWTAAEQDRKKRKTEEAERVELVKTLEARDESIVVLRELLAEKSAIAKEAPKSQPAPDYDKMDAATLKRLEKARDGTISWILKAIDKAEQQSSQ